MTKCYSGSWELSSMEIRLQHSQPTYRVEFKTGENTSVTTTVDVPEGVAGLSLQSLVDIAAKQAEQET